ncbi:MAG: alkane 1-monooxygenase [Paracoccus sp. (in: a-proteobacteria)]|uniref:alkane 1-monooxygenase n=1 Tax=Paracoccus sp. TaxID=267 RepID=UPI0026DEC105|nr:alkane 1-monooxygenase [Paracoccus sp. (in: a-proteobacteria)]MDO5621141.1 alkane 1-monooxygenase [Paracoccus sp. (in: a-proteobacteria)]
MDRIFSKAPQARAFAAVALLPAVLLILGSGGGWPLWLGFLWIAGVSQTADTLIARGFPDAETEDFPLSDTALCLIAAAHFALLIVALRAFASDALTTPERIALFLASGMYFGQVSNATAHELIHRSHRALFRLGAGTYVSLLFGHHTSAHRLVHHIHVATDNDPNTARMGESFWHFFPRAWIGSFRAGLVAEQTRAARSGRMNPYVWWVSGGIACIILTAASLGPRTALTYVALCLYAQAQLMLSDYVQHYGLRRQNRDGRPEPVGPQHSWDARHPLSSLMMVNAPRHSDHHAHPTRAYPALRLSREAHPRPILPYSLPVMGAIALIPPLWRRIMDRRVARMQSR